MLTWQPLRFAASYDVEIYLGPTRVVNTNTKYSSWVPTDPIPVSTDDYTWHVRRVDATGLRGDWSETRRFRIAASRRLPWHPPSPPSSPPSGSLFSWLPDSRATNYRFERRKPGGVDLAETVTTRATAWAPTTALAAGTAQWRVVALDAKGASLGASPWRPSWSSTRPQWSPQSRSQAAARSAPTSGSTAPTFDPAVATTTYQWLRGTSVHHRRAPAPRTP